MDLGSLLTSIASRSGQKIAITCQDRKLSFEDLDSAATHLAKWLLRHGLQHADQVAIHWSNSIEVVTLYFACLKAGLLIAPVNARLKLPEVAYILSDSGASICFSQPGLLPANHQIAQICPSLRAIYHQLPPIEEDLSEVLLPTIRPDALAFNLYTSGSTAKPKGTMHTQNTLFHMAMTLAVAGVFAQETVIQLTSAMHVSGLYWAIATVISGATAVIVPEFSAPVVLDLIESNRCTMMFGLPSTLHALVQEQARSPRHVDSLKLCAGGGDSLPISLRSRFESVFKKPLHELYGLTECLQVFSIPGPEVVAPGSVGPAAAGVELRLVDTEGRDVEPGESGELTIRSPGLFKEYWRKTDATDAVLTDGEFFTGDYFRCDPNGLYWFQYRKKDIIIRGGSNISPREIEEVLSHHPGVYESGVVGLPDPIYGECVAAFVVLNDSNCYTEHDLKEFCRTRLADYKIPGQIAFVSELPRNASGKLMRRHLRDMAATSQ